MVYNYLVTIVCEYMTVSTIVETDMAPDFSGGPTASIDQPVLEEALEQIKERYGVDLDKFVEEWTWEER
jgi:hypothetical protein